MLTGFVSAIAGAILMWLTLGVAMNNSQPQPVLASEPAILAGAQLRPPVVSASEAMPVSVPAPVQKDIAESQVREMVEGWRLAWERRDVQVYLQYYGPQFVAANGQKRPDWDKGRQRNFLGRSWIRVDVKEMRTERIDENQIKVFFMQDYASDVYKEASQPKTLLIERRDNKWEIAGEWEGTK